MFFHILKLSKYDLDNTNKVSCHIGDKYPYLIKGGERDVSEIDADYYNLVYVIGYLIHEGELL
jgi:hypothetical protein